MSTTLWNSTVDSIGADAAEMLEAGVVILFGSPVPDELAEVSLVHGLGVTGRCHHRRMWSPVTGSGSGPPST